MLKRYQIELERNERDFATFLRSRDVTLSKTELRVLIASRALEDRQSLFDIENFKNIRPGKKKAKTQSSVEKVDLKDQKAIKHL